MSPSIDAANRDPAVISPINADPSEPINAVDSVAPAVILLVDDEANILTSLKRLFRPTGYTILTAASGVEALALLAHEPIDLIISDMRMPGISGAQLLSECKRRYPDRIRILLTGYADIESTVAAINDAEVFHYLQKPWDEYHLLLTVRRGLEQRQLKIEAQRLSALVLQQNQTLQTFNAELESQVSARTEEIKTNFVTMLKVFSNVIELRAGMLGGQSGRVADLARRVGVKCALSEDSLQELSTASLLHAIGKLSLSDDLVSKPIDKMNVEEMRHFMQHPLKGQTVLMPLDRFSNIGLIIRHQYERYNGNGTPDRLNALQIPIGARILALVRDFEALRSGALTSHTFSQEKALELLGLQIQLRYDPVIFGHFVAVMEELDSNSLATLKLTSTALDVGMRLAEDLRSHDGVLLLMRDSLLTYSNIGQIQKFEKRGDTPLHIVIVWEGSAPA